MLTRLSDGNAEEVIRITARRSGPPVSRFVTRPTDRARALSRPAGRRAAAQVASAAALALARPTNAARQASPRRGEAREFAKQEASLDAACYFLSTRSTLLRLPVSDRDAPGAALHTLQELRVVPLAFLDGVERNHEVVSRRQSLEREQSALIGARRPDRTRAFSPFRAVVREHNDRSLPQDSASRRGRLPLMIVGRLVSTTRTPDSVLPCSIGSGRSATSRPSISMALSVHSPVNGPIGKHGVAEDALDCERPVTLDPAVVGMQHRQSSSGRSD